MDAELRKRLEEAAKDFTDKHGFRVPYDGSNDFYDETDVKASKDGFLAGAEYGYKEAIALAKEWLDSNSENYLGLINEEKLTASTFRTAQFITDFETDMNELWEEKKC